MSDEDKLEKLNAKMAAEVAAIEAKMEKRRKQEAGEVITYPHTRIVRGNEVPIVCKENTKALLDFEGIQYKYSEMKQKVELTFKEDIFKKDTLENDQLQELVNRAIHSEYRISDKELDKHISLLSPSYHPVRDFINQKKWDGTTRLPELFDSLTTDHPMKELLITKWLIGMVSVIMKPQGGRVEGVLVLDGDQGIGKTTWLKSLVPNSDWIKEGVSLDPKHKDTVIEALSAWIVELGELGSTFRRADVDILKAFLSKDNDHYRPPYAAKANEYPRRTGFFATVDNGKFLIDKIGNRRFWVLDIKKVNTNHGIDLQQLWAEIAVYFGKGMNHWLNPNELAQLNEANEQFQVSDVVTDTLEDWDVRKFNPDTAVYDFTGNITNLLKQLGFAHPKQLELRQAGDYIRKHGIEFYDKGKRSYRMSIDPDWRKLRGLGIRNRLGNFVNDEDDVIRMTFKQNNEKHRKPH